MTRIIRRSTVLLGILFALSSLSFATTLYIYPSVGPSWASTYLNDYQVNAVNAIRDQSVIDPLLPSSAGNPAFPSFYSQVDHNQITPFDLITTNDGVDSFNSWLGDTSPAGNFAGEFGNAIFFGLFVSSPGAGQFTMQDVLFDGDFVPGQSLAGVSFSNHTVGYACDASATSYLDASCVRYDDGNPGAGDTQPINFLYTSGFFAYDLVGLIGDYQNHYQALNGASGIQGYSLFSDSASANINIVPEPGTLVLFGLGFGAAWCFRRKAAV